MDVPVRISVDGCSAEDHHWRVRWLVSNECDAPIVLEDAWVPHGRFRGDGHVLLDARVTAGGTYVLTLSVSGSEAPGTVVENAFLILRVRADSAVWRVFARMHVEFSADAVRPVVEVVTAQRV